MAAGTWRGGDWCASYSEFLSDCGDDTSGKVCVVWFLSDFYGVNIGEVILGLCLIMHWRDCSLARHLSRCHSNSEPSAAGPGILLNPRLARHSRLFTSV